jgi:hypothetical protein
MRDGVSHPCHTALRKLARPAGLEPATPGLEGEIPNAQNVGIQQLVQGAMPRCHARLTLSRSLGRQNLPRSILADLDLVAAPFASSSIR